MKEAEFKHFYFLAQLVFSVCAIRGLETRADVDTNVHVIMTEEVGLYPAARPRFRDLSIYGSTALCWTLAAFSVS
jgi:hypothetical protein